VSSILNQSKKKAIPIVKKPLILGTANFNRDYRLNRTIDFDAQEILKCAFDNGIQRLDVSDTYLGAYNEIQKSGLKWKLNAKIVLSLNSRNYYVEILEKVLELSRNIPKAKIENLMIHNGSSMPKSSLDEAFESMNLIAKDLGFEPSGISFYPDDTNQMSVKKLTLIQIPLNVLDHRGLDLHVNSGVFSKIEGVQARSLYLRGLLLSEPEAPKLKTNLQLDEVNKFVTWCKISSIDPLFACFNFVYHLSFVTSIVVGVNSGDELVANLDALRDSEKYKIEADFTRFKSSNLALIDPRNWKS
jgi:hypothetical protein